jgi:hypothetical protein
LAITDQLAADEYRHDTKAASLARLWRLAKGL